MCSGILISWVSVGNDPYEKSIHTDDLVMDDSGKKIEGPTLTVLFHPRSVIRDKISKVHLLYQSTSSKDYKSQASNLKNVLLAKNNNLEIELHPCDLKDPTDHDKIASIVIPLVANIQRGSQNGKLYVHISPGTPAMHAVWMHISESGFIPGEYSILKSYREGEHDDNKRIVEVPRGFSGRIRTLGMDAVLSKKDSFNYEQCRSEPYRQLLQEIKRVADLRVPILLFGERGSGKTTLARFIRDTSRFRKPKLDDCWPVVACGQFSGDLIRSELFGHRKGAYTGAIEQNPGLLDHIHEDTLFLDEVADLDLDTQRLLIRAIEEGKYTPVGSDQVKNSKFRLICATNRTPSEVLQRMHLDFRDRISYFEISVPPFRETKEDLELFWGNVYEKAVERSEANNPSIPSQKHMQWIVRKLNDYPLHGNFRDLYKVAYHLIARRWWEIPDEDIADRADNWVDGILDSHVANQCHDKVTDTWNALSRGLSGSHDEYRNVFLKDSPIDLKSFISWVQNVCAFEAKAYADENRISIDKVVRNPSSETLRKWRKNVE